MNNNNSKRETQLDNLYLLKYICFTIFVYFEMKKKIPITKFRVVCVTGRRIIAIHEAIPLLIFLHLYQRFLNNDSQIAYENVTPLIRPTYRI
jgi:hypothetical protein